MMMTTFPFALVNLNLRTLINFCWVINLIFSSASFTESVVDGLAILLIWIIWSNLMLRMIIFVFTVGLLGYKIMSIAWISLWFIWILLHF